jgi:carbon-monoxide dehydrogenase catalytic subunit
MAEIEELSACETTLEMLKKAKEDEQETAFDRVQYQKGCAFGEAGTCCRICNMGPCRINPKKPDDSRGVCGANVDTIAARNFARMVAGGASAHSDHGRAVAETMIMALKGEATDYGIKDRIKLLELADDLDIEVGEREIGDIALELSERCLAMFGQQEGELAMAQRAPEKRKEIWRQLGIFPRGIDREIVEIMHRTHIGVDQHYENILMASARAALSDGWGGSMIGTELQDVLFDTPVPIEAKIDLGVIDEEQVNIIVHGHEPILSEMIVLAASLPEMQEKAEKVGAKGINLAGICCTANEVLMRHGIPVAGNVLQQEMALLTGAVEAMVVDVQCIYQGIGQIANCIHSDIITTSPKAKMPYAKHIEFHEDRALEIAKEIVSSAIDNFKNRGKVSIPQRSEALIAGFDHEYINYMLGGKFRASYRPLNDAVIDGRIRGVVGVVGCNNPRVKHDDIHVRVTRELIANGCLVVMTGCAAQSVAKAGLMLPEVAREICPQGLWEVCEAVGIPPVLHAGSCVDNSRILISLTAMVNEGGLGDDISDLPAAGCAPEWMSEKAISIGEYFVASGVTTVFGVSWPTTGSKNVTDFLFEGYKDVLKSSWDYEPDPEKMVGKLLSIIDSKREALGIMAKRERVLFDMAMRRELEI